MGTHSIFESDFDCLTDAKMKDEPTTFQNLEYEKGSRLLNFTPLQFFFTLACSFIICGLLTWTTIVYFDRQITNLDELFEDEVSEQQTDYGADYYGPERFQIVMFITIIYGKIKMHLF